MKKLFLSILFFCVLGIAICYPKRAVGEPTWVTIEWVNGMKTTFSTEHYNYVVFNLRRHDGEERRNTRTGKTIQNCCCIHDWNGSNAGYQVTHEVYKAIVAAILSSNMSNSLVDFSSGETWANGYNDIWLDPKYIVSIENADDKVTRTHVVYSPSPKH